MIELDTDERSRHRVAVATTSKRKNRDSRYSALAINVIPISTMKNDIDSQIRASNVVEPDCGDVTTRISRPNRQKIVMRVLTAMNHPLSIVDRQTDLILEYMIFPWRSCCAQHIFPGY